MAEHYLKTGALVLSALGTAGATAPSAAPNVQRHSILDVTPPAARVLTKVEASTVRFGPGQASGRHMHPHPVVGLVSEGTFILQIEGQAAVTLKQGDGFYEPADVTILRFDNASSAAAATMTAFYLVGDASKPVTVMLPDR
ncbi:cupin domain-containing protein [Sphingomonas sp. UYP23]